MEQQPTSMPSDASRRGSLETHLCSKLLNAKKGSFVPFLWKLVEFLHKLWQLISGIINFSHYNNSISSNLHNNLGDFKYFHQKSNARRTRTSPSSRLLLRSLLRPNDHRTKHIQGASQPLNTVDLLALSAVAVVQVRVVDSHRPTRSKYNNQILPQILN